MKQTYRVRILPLFLVLLGVPLILLMLVAVALLIPIIFPF